MKASKTKIVIILIGVFWLMKIVSCVANSGEPQSLSDEVIGQIAWSEIKSDLKYDSSMSAYDIVDKIIQEDNEVYFVYVEGQAQNGFGAWKQMQCPVILWNPEYDEAEGIYRWGRQSYWDDFSGFGGRSAATVFLENEKENIEEDLRKENESEE